jgi:transposase
MILTCIPCLNIRHIRCEGDGCACSVCKRRPVRVKREKVFLTPEQQQGIAAKLLEGYSQAAVAADFGVSRDKVRTVYRTLGIVRKRAPRSSYGGAGGRPSSLSDADWKRAEELLKSGVSISETARQVGSTRDKIRTVAKNIGIVWIKPEPKEKVDKKQRFLVSCSLCEAPPMSWKSMGTHYKNMHPDVTDIRLLGVNG